MKSELFKLIPDPDGHEQPEESEENQETALQKSDAISRETRGYTNFQALIKPVREAEISLVRLDQHLVTLHDVDPKATSQYSRLATTLIAGALRNPPLKRILITSAHHGEGRTCVMINLAASLARAKQRVLLIDTDMVRPSVARLLGVDTEIGLVEALAEEIIPEATVIRIVPAGFDILPTRAQVQNSAELLASKDFMNFIGSLDANYDFILFDSAPLLDSADASLLVLQTHATLMVVRPGYTTTSQMARAVSILNEESLFGVVLNRVTK